MAAAPKPAALYGAAAPQPTRSRGPRERIDEAETARLLSQLAAIVDAGVPLLEAMQLLAETGPSAQRPLLERIREDLTSGLGLAQSFAAHPRHFDVVCRRLVAAGERGADLGACLRHAASYMQARDRRRRQLRRAAFYPSIVAGAALMVAAVLLVKIIPQFELIFAEFDAELPALTRVIIALSNGLREHAPLAVAAISAAAALASAPGLADRRRRWLLRLPLLGPWLRLEALARFCSIAALALQARIELPEALRLASDAGGGELSSAGTRALQRLPAGSTVAAAFAEETAFPPLMIRMIAIGERSGRMAELLDSLGRQYREAAIERGERAVAALEPLSILFLGALIGALILAMYLPIFELGGAL